MASSDSMLAWILPLCILGVLLAICILVPLLCKRYLTSMWNDLWCQDCCRGTFYWADCCSASGCDCCVPSKKQRQAEYMKRSKYHDEYVLVTPHGIRQVDPPPTVKSAIGGHSRQSSQSRDSSSFSRKLPYSQEPPPGHTSLTQSAVQEHNQTPGSTPLQQQGSSSVAPTWGTATQATNDNGNVNINGINGNGNNNGLKSILSSSKPVAPVNAYEVPRSGSIARLHRSLSSSESGPARPTNLFGSGAPLTDLSPSREAARLPVFEPTRSPGSYGYNTTTYNNYDAHTTASPNYNTNNYLSSPTSAPGSPSNYNYSTTKDLLSGRPSIPTLNDYTSSPVYSGTTGNVNLASTLPKYTPSANYTTDLQRSSYNAGESSWTADGTPSGWAYKPLSSPGYTGDGAATPEGYMTTNTYRVTTTNEDRRVVHVSPYAAD